MFNREGLTESYGFPFSAEAISTLNSAEEGARKFRHKYIGAEHILLGLGKHNSATLRRLGIAVEKLEGIVEFLMGRGDVEISTLDLSPRARLVVELSVIAARAFGDIAVTPNHLLLGIVEDKEEGIGSMILESYGVSILEVRQVVKNP